MAPITANRRKTWALDNFGAGIDRRDGLIAREQNRFWDLINCHITKGKRVRRRPPIVKVSGTFGATAYGHFQRNGVQYAFAPRGSAPTTPTGVSLLLFDIPPGATVHRLVDLEDLGDTVVALFDHTIAGVHQYWLHIFDDEPDFLTYTQDPEFPWLHFSGALPRSVLAVVANKVWMGGPEGDTHHSGVARPRTWWTRTLEDIIAGGYEYHFLIAAGTTDLTIAVNADNVGGYAGGYVAWTVEKYIGASTAIADYRKRDNWSAPITEVIGVPAAEQCFFTTTANTSTGASYTNWLKVRVNSTAGGWYRVRLFPPNGIDFPRFNYMYSGVVSAGVADAQYVSAITRGNALSVDFELDPSVFCYVSTTTCWAVTVDGVAKTYTTDFTILNPSGKQARLHFVAAPADGSLIEVKLLTRDVTGGRYVIPPGIINTRTGRKQWGGGDVAVESSDGSYMLVIQLDAAGNPTVPALVAVNLTGKLLYESVVVASIFKAGATYHYTIQLTVGQLAAQAYKPGSAFITIRSVGVGSTWSDERLYQQVLDDVGATETTSDAGFIPTASHDSGGGPVTALIGDKDRLIVYFAAGAQLWIVNENGNLDRLVDHSEVGTGTQNQAHGVLFAGSVMISAITGPRIVSLIGFNYDRLDDTDLEESIDRLGIPIAQASAQWPWMGQYVSAVTINGAFGFLVFDYSKESKVSAWSQWFGAGISSVDYKTMIAVNDRLYFRSGSNLYYFDANAYRATSPSFRDSNDALGAGNAYLSRARWNFNDFQKPGMQKRFVFFDIIQTGFGLDVNGNTNPGVSSLSFKMVASDTSQELSAFAEAGTTYGRMRDGLSMRADALAPILESTDENGWELQRIAFEFLYERR